uniref:Uncharacterized protein n=1 Tax=Oryza rufipogon TaxID=4529 RepID=A0A0E0PE62_ORYRU
MGEPLRNGLIGPILLETFEYPSDSNVETYTRVYDDPEEEEGTTLDEAGNFNDNLENNIEEKIGRPLSPRKRAGNLTSAMNMISDICS